MNFDVGAALQIFICGGFVGVILIWMVKNACDARYESKTFAKNMEIASLQRRIREQETEIDQLRLQAKKRLEELIEINRRFLSYVEEETQWKESILSSRGNPQGREGHDFPGQGTAGHRIKP